MSGGSIARRIAVTHGPMIAGIIAILLSTAGVIVYTNRTLHSIENNLPSTLLTELNSLAHARDSLGEVATSARIAAATGDREHIARLRSDIYTTYRLIVDLRNTYVTDNLINASSFHAVVAPAIADIRIWLDEGVSGYGPDSDVTLAIVESRVAETFAKAAKIQSDSRNAAQIILDSQRKRLETFQHSVNALFAFILFLVCLLVVLLIRQSRATVRESEARGELQQQHDLLGSLLHSIPQGIAVWDRNLDVVHLNSAFTAITGYDRSDLPNMRKWPALAYPDPVYRRDVIAHWKSSSRNNSASEYRIVCKDGQTRDIEFRAAYLPDERIITTLNDVTERNLREREIQESRLAESRARKMESLGLLAGGVAHDLNNILSGIVSYPELLLFELAPDDRLRRPIELMRESGLRATAIVQDLLTVARGVAVEKEPINLNAVIEEYLGSSDFRTVQKFHPGIEVEADLADNLANVVGSRVHLRKILMNLISNACEATDAAGIVRVATANRVVDQPPRDTADLDEGEYVTLTVADQGKGISTEDLEKIFEPFYSKKVMGRSGTGLGLTVVWNVVQDHRGHIDVATSAGGTTFTISLPSTSSPARQPQQTVDLSLYRGGGETILVVDDVATQRQITCSILDRLGYRAEAVPGGEAAVEFVRKQPVDLVLLDMIMSPGISGRETYERITRLHPGQKALIVSGYAETEDVRETLRLGAAAFLKKPLMIHDLATTIHSILRAGGGQPGTSPADPARR
ncbi:MAG: response regulator [Desulfobulbaceae bacterium]|nr:MAG: response regulator [Desulfobulbaceae bacterium]